MNNFESSRSPPPISTTLRDAPSKAERLTPAETTPPAVDVAPSSGSGSSVGAAADLCAWCGRGAAIEADLGGVDGAGPSTTGEDDGRRVTSQDQLRFCSRTCLSRYKMDLFCSETRRYLQELQGTDKVNSGVGSDDVSEQRILITPELWNQCEQTSADDHDLAVSVNPRLGWNNTDDSAVNRRRRTNDDGEADDAVRSGTARAKVRRVNTTGSGGQDRPTTSRRQGRSLTGVDEPHISHPRGTPTRTSTRKDLPSVTIKSETDLEPATSRTENLGGVRFPWMSHTSNSISGLPPPLPQAFLSGSFWPQAPVGIPATFSRPSFPASAPLPLDLAAAGWPNPGLIPPSAMLVPYPIPIPLPLPLPIPIPVPLSSLTTDACSTSPKERSGSQTLEERSQPEVWSSTQAKNDQSGSERCSSATPDQSCGSSPALESSSALDLSTGGFRSRSAAAAPIVSASDPPTVDSSPYLARRSLILDAPAVDRKFFGDQTTSVGGVRASASAAPVNKRFNQHRRRTTHVVPLVESK